MTSVRIPIKLLVVYSFICLLASFGLFLKGFMPTKTGLPGNVTTTTSQGSDDIAISHFPVFDKLVIVMIDALRADFVLGKSSHMRYVRGLVDEKETIPLLVQTRPPTVTLPRIKALTTGDIPGFVDVVLNFDSQVLTEDNLLSQFHRANKKLIFYGDDTWLKLFPRYFMRSEGTTSFFVTDYVEVDSNVTRHLDSELDQSDWDVMILHYLGLDHIGHLAGPNSPLIRPKLEEMDRIVEQIHKKLLAKADNGVGESLILVCGDHGMSDQGGHGGASIEEIFVPAIFISTAFSKSNDSGLAFTSSSSIEQIDITPTLSLLFGLPIPQNSLGVLIPQLFRDVGIEEKVSLYQTNAEQLFNILEQNVLDIEKESSYHVYQKAQRSHHTWLTVHKETMLLNAWENLGKGILQHYQQAMLAMQSRITSSLTKYDMYAMMLGIFSLWLIFVVTLLSIGQDHILLSFDATCLLGAMTALLISTVSHLTVCTSSWRSDLLCGTSIYLLLLQSYFIIMISIFALILVSGCQGSSNQLSGKLKKVLPIYCLDCVLLYGTILHTLSLMSSSFVEEEHQTWYFYTVTFHLSSALLIIYQALQTTNSCSSKMNNTIDSPLSTKARGIIVYDEKMKKPADSNTFEIQAGDNQSDNMYKDLRHNTKYPKVLKAGTSKLSQKYGMCSTGSDNKPEGSLSELCHTTADAHLKQLWQDHWGSLSSILVVVVLSRVARAWNQTGNKWLSNPDIGDWLVCPENQSVLSGSVLASMLVICFLRNRAHVGLVKLLFPMGMLGIYLFRSADGSLLSPWTTAGINQGTTEARMVYAVIGLIITESLWMSRAAISESDLQAGGSGFIPCSEFWEKLHSAWILFMALLSRPHNIVLVSVATIQEHLISKYVLPHWDLSMSGIALYYLWMGQAAFFCQGNSNSISTMDVSAAYIGMEQYQPVLIGFLMCLSTYAGLLFWMIGLAKTLSHRSRNLRGMSVVSSACNTLLLTRLFSLSVYCVLVTAQRYHLFVWTVFSPKLLYEGMLSPVIAIWSLIIMIVL